MVSDMHLVDLLLTPILFDYLGRTLPVTVTPPRSGAASCRLQAAVTCAPLKNRKAEHSFGWLMT